MAEIVNLWWRARSCPQTREYAENIYITLHKVSNSMSQFCLNCNGCRSISQYFPINDPVQARVALQILQEIFAPYREYFANGMVGVGNGRFHDEDPPQPSLPHVMPYNWRDCFHETQKRIVKITGDRLAREQTAAVAKAPAAPPPTLTGNPTAPLPQNLQAPPTAPEPNRPAPPPRRHHSRRRLGTCCPVGRRWRHSHRI